ncbi:hypothetical protein LCGC14_1912380 [marine sediment metagenome]|uniref:Uncharacterized protein n=1 Tax=marine sediment metagenome TaxID=412755 RepID=A0A0F9FT18_9ZZZZ
MNKESEQKERILKLLMRAWRYEPDCGLLCVIGSCFAAGDISHITDDVLEDNLKSLIDMEKDRRRGGCRKPLTKGENK